MASLVTGSTVNSNLIWHAGNYNRVIARGNPGSATPLLLSSFGEIHYYLGTNTATIDISTTMVENSVYEVNYFTTSTGSNSDPIILPNYTSYSGEFSCFYWGSPTFTVFDQPSLSGFYFDHYGGGVGANPCGTFLCFNQRNRKQCNYYGGDTGSVALGTGRWNNTTTQWTNVGRFQGIQPSTELRIYVRRVG